MVVIDNDVRLDHHHVHRSFLLMSPETFEECLFDMPLNETEMQMSWRAVQRGSLNLKCSRYPLNTPLKFHCQIDYHMLEKIRWMFLAVII